MKFSESVWAFITLHEELNLNCLHAILASDILEIESLSSANPSSIEKIRKDFNKLLLSINDPNQVFDNNNNSNSKIKFATAIFETDKIHLYKKQYKDALTERNFYQMGKLFSKVPDQNLNEFLQNHQETIKNLATEYEPIIVLRQYFTTQLKTISSAFVKKYALNRHHEHDIKDIRKNYELQLSLLEEDKSASLSVRKQQFKLLFKNFTGELNNYVINKCKRVVDHNVQSYEASIDAELNQLVTENIDNKQCEQQNENANESEQDNEVESKLVQDVENISAQNKKAEGEFDQVEQQNQSEQRVKMLEDTETSVNQSSKENNPATIDIEEQPKSKGRMRFPDLKKLGDKIKNLVQNNNQKLFTEPTEIKNENPVYGINILTPAEKQALKIQENKKHITNVIQKYVFSRKDLDLSTQHALCKYLYKKAKQNETILNDASLTDTAIHTFINKEQERFRTFTYNQKDRFYKTIRMQVPLIEIGFLTASEKVYPVEKALIVASPKVFKK